MNIAKLLKQLLSDSYEVEGELNDIIKQCFEEMFKEHKGYAFSLFEEDLQNGRAYNGCLQGLDYYKQEIGKLKEAAENRAQRIKNAEND